MVKQFLHSTAVAFETDAGPAGVMILGKSGAGKSELALELISLGAQLVADDQTELRRDGNIIRLFTPPALRGLIELRGLGILTLDYVDSVALAVAVDLDVAETARLPERHVRSFLGLDIPCLHYCESRVFAIGLKHYVVSQHWLNKEV